MDFVLAWLCGARWSARAVSKAALLQPRDWHDSVKQRTAPEVVSITLNPPHAQLIAPTILPRPTGGGGSQATAAAAAAAAAAPAAAAAAAAAKAASAPAPRSHKKGASGSKADGKTKLVGAAKAAHERALARKAAEAAAAAGAAGQAAASDMQSMLEAGGSQPMPGLVARPQGAPPPALQQRAQQNGGGADNSSEGDAADLCASDSSEQRVEC